LLLLRLNRKQDGLNLLERAIRANPQDSDLPLTKAIMLGLMDRIADAEKTLREVELRWPEWDRAYLVHGLLLERATRRGRPDRDFRPRLHWVQDPGLRCAQARLAGGANPEPECTCQSGLEQPPAGCVHRD
jgi:hypothetical protein